MAASSNTILNFASLAFVILLSISKQASAKNIIYVGYTDWILNAQTHEYFVQSARNANSKDQVFAVLTPRGNGDNSENEISLQIRTQLEGLNLPNHSVSQLIIATHGRTERKDKGTSTSLKGVGSFSETKVDELFHQTSLAV